MKTSTIFAIGSGIAGCALAAYKLTKTIKRCHEDCARLDEIEMTARSSYEKELAELQANHDAEMAALEEMDKKNKADHEDRMAEMKAHYMENVEKMEEIRKELLKNVDMRKNATPEEALKLEERDKELLKELSEIRM